MADAPSGGVNLQFEWDDDKAASNLEKHGVSFEEAATVFRDPFALIFDDEAHSIGEQREIMIGHSTRNRLLLDVCFVNTPPVTGRATGRSPLQAKDEALA